MVFSLSWGIAAAAEEVDPSAGGEIHPETLPAQAVIWLQQLQKFTKNFISKRVVSASGSRRGT